MKPIDYKNFFNEKRLWWVIAVMGALIVGAVMVVLVGSQRLAAILTVPIFMLLFTGFDYVGFSTLISANEKTMKIIAECADRIEARLGNLEAVMESQFKSNIVAYRILQGTFHVCLLAVIWLAAGWKAAAACEVVHWFGVCDLLYYGMLRFPLPPSWDWLGWTPLGIITGGLPISATAMYAQCAVGLILAGVMVAI